MISLVNILQIKDHHLWERKFGPWKSQGKNTQARAKYTLLMFCSESLVILLIAGKAFDPLRAAMEMMEGDLDQEGKEEVAVENKEVMMENKEEQLEQPNKSK